MSDYADISELQPKLASLVIAPVPSSDTLGTSYLQAPGHFNPPTLPPRGRAATLATPTTSDPLYAVVDKKLKTAVLGNAAPRPHDRFTEAELDSVFDDLDIMASAILSAGKGAGMNTVAFRDAAPSPLVAPRPASLFFPDGEKPPLPANHPAERTKSDVYDVPADTILSAAAARSLTSAQSFVSSPEYESFSDLKKAPATLPRSAQLNYASLAHASGAEAAQALAPEPAKKEEPAAEPVPQHDAAGVPLCATCRNPVTSTQPALEALGRTWHHDHFVCHACKLPITGNFFHHNDMPYCHRDYLNAIAPKCALCNLPVVERGLHAMNKDWHAACFACAKCGSPLKEYMLVNGKPYCQEGTCKVSLSSADVKQGDHCRGCQALITDEFLVALGAHWHKPCFCCKTCGSQLQDGGFFVHEGHPYCILDYQAVTGVICVTCSKPIVGEVLTFNSSYYHKTCFTCERPGCPEVLGGQFYNFNNKRFCVAHGTEMLQNLTAKYIYTGSK
ncbi:hypothetical protein CAOG_04110 [Capsaspora owczarzaki ATCC 30864]|uniref:LIM zinc-binding domain-containing protein n=1 Tax=Capsaspora owczarzaki (strain ATCC 30864) TaxID=595528 RepID=A0A0D2WQN3_CAPO3|nr:hypothetical protein CAOG_04110 [Capsaspora owczarzaki ATCC 30864]KJE93303.1 hypothetical protein CAOG_004110 [Capsaspora owczarzaki ATCC 30864]|eukprot:XP_004347935.2 hypothetical protein CAOG_04110 [Capsaspora owczarzaki ATCC 30864]